MKTMQHLFHALEQKTAIQILLFLLKHGDKVKITSILRSDDIAGGHSATYSAIDKLLKANLIQDEQSAERSLRPIFLTQLGKAVAGELKKLETYYQANKKS